MAEPQYASCFDDPIVPLGVMTGTTWRHDAKRLGFVLARYQFVARMLAGKGLVAEIGCGDGFASKLVNDVVTDRLDLYDFDPKWVVEAGRNHAGFVGTHDIVAEPIDDAPYDAIYMLDVLEHIRIGDEPRAMNNIVASLNPSGVLIVGMPSLESQVYASAQSKLGHVNCKTGERLVASMRRYFHTVFLFGMNDSVLHVGFAPMCHYLLALCVGPRALIKDVSHG